MASRLAQRAALLGSKLGAAAPLWEKVNALAQRPGMINMGQGFPDFAGSRVAREAAMSAMARGDAASNQYSPQPGYYDLRTEISNFVARRYGSSTAPDPASEVVVTAGAQESLAAAFLSFLDPGDEVVVFEPFYPFMLGAIAQAGAVPRVVTLRSDDGFAIDEAALRAAAASPRARMLVLNSPHNPTGHVATPAELRLVADVCEQHDLIAISDEVYEACVFPHAVGAAHNRLVDVPGMRERTITLGSGGKLFALTGWRVAWAYGPSALIGPIGRSHTHMTFSAPSPLQLGIAAALAVDDGLDATGPLFGANFEALASTLREAIPSVRDVCAAEGGYFLVAQTDGTPDVAFCEQLAESKGVVCTPMSVFYSTPFAPDEPCTLVRFTVCKSKEYVRNACAALSK